MTKKWDFPKWVRKGKFVFFCDKTVRRVLATRRVGSNYGDVYLQGYARPVFFSSHGSPYITEIPPKLLAFVKEYDRLLQEGRRPSWDYVSVDRITDEQILLQIWVNRGEIANHHLYATKLILPIYYYNHTVVPKIYVTVNKRAYEKLSLDTLCCYPHQTTRCKVCNVYVEHCLCEKLKLKGRHR